MIDRGLDSLHRAAADGSALGSFTIYTMESAVAVARAAHRRDRAVILQAASGCFVDVGRAELAGLMGVVAEASAGPVGLHLDHSTDLDEISACLRHGFTSVMFDGSHLPFEENVAATREAAGLARATSAWVEGELGAVGGDEDASGGDASGVRLTDVEQAEEFVHRTGVDALAVSVGNVHGVADRVAALDLDRLAAIAAVVDVPLVLHGASGLPADQVRRAVAIGVAKVNVNTELRRAHLAALRSQHDRDGDDIRPVRRRAIDEMAQVAERFVSLLSPPGPASRS
ncbi:ketose-bisphosphate aldolase [Aeromicrobium sp. A1-2]|uniref:class II fructose-bisphosphate aldolase n=1 Tax=Aeromicrobium sp. A1-2 TaxID=2107713 RepID=UPI000E54BF7E|nr:class II fructose-bisphosphate aldolase [Aeromicrobium sp. A1-2]AXT84267.1 ketose-bisphosphate aldolase [Aeromicrobium sp. A1-2]